MLSIAFPCFIQTPIYHTQDFITPACFRSSGGGTVDMACCAELVRTFATIFDSGPSTFWTSQMISAA
jgi:hypothetical protein